MALAQLQEIEAFYSTPFAPPASNPPTAQDRVDRIISGSKTLESGLKERIKRDQRVGLLLDAAIPNLLTTADIDEIQKLRDVIERGRFTLAESRSRLERTIVDFESRYRSSSNGLMRFAPGTRRAVRKAMESAISVGNAYIAHRRVEDARERDWLRQLDEHLRKIVPEASSPPDPWPPE